MLIFTLYLIIYLSLLFRRSMTPIKRGKQDFRRWLDVALDKGAKGAHKWTNAPNAVEAIDPFACGDIVFDSPIVAINHRADKWQRLWCRDADNKENIINVVVGLIAECSNGVGVDKVGYGSITSNLYDQAVNKLPSHTGKGAICGALPFLRACPTVPKMIFSRNIILWSTLLLRLFE